MVDDRYPRSMLLNYEGGRVGNGRDRFYRTLNTNKGLPILAGTGVLLTPCLLRLCCHVPGRPSRASWQPPNSHDCLCFADAFFLAGGRK